MDERGINMPVQLDSVIKGIAGQAVNRVNDLSKALNALEELNDFATDAISTGETFLDYEEVIQSAFPHLDGSKLNQVLGVILPDLLVWLESQVVTSGDYAGKNYAEMLNKIRSV